MSKPILQLFGLIVLLFTVLIVWTTRWTVIDAQSLNDNKLNHRTLIASERIKLGRILADDGTVLAESVPQRGGIWSRRYPTGPKFAQSVGYAYVSTGRFSGLESFYRDQLRGQGTGLSSVFGQLSTGQQVGNDLYTSLDPKAQQAAIAGLGSQRGSVVALDPRTGAILAMYANPSYDDNDQHAASTFNLSLQSQSPPGSTFKVVTTTAAIDSGRYTPGSTLNGDSPKTISGVPLQNDYNQSFGTIDLTTALTQSVNTVFAQLAVSLGTGTMTQYMQRFGFYAKPPVDFPSTETVSSKPYSSHGRPLAPGSRDQDLGRIGIGQGGLLVTPMQMAMVVGAVANGGALMRPHFATKVVNSDGQTVQSIGATVYNQVMKPSVAQQINGMMRKVVEEGTGTPAQLGGGVLVAGKTGTASIGAQGQNLTEPWFIGFAPADHPTVAVAVTIERSQGGFGGTVAAPIAKSVIQTVLSEGR
jgi:peptidoglycan glycosyltransferase